MRIQHNIMAMNAYRNYSNNTSALSQNLEKLSSGYKINRAGDDAAGLAISEKMRAQITGLEQAQDNAASGKNLVNTAEGALQEVHDMLNRMVKLADQSANGTYNDATDRTALQDEVDQLLDEIDRIADSANYNGISLLNGDLAVTYQSGSKTIGGAEFEVSLDDIVNASDVKSFSFGFNVATSSTASATKAAITKSGAVTVTISTKGLKTGDTISADDIQKALADAIASYSGNNSEITNAIKGLKLNISGNIAVKTGAALSGAGAITTNAGDDSNALVLQIGDTSDDFNQLKVGISDMHADKLGIAGISVATQEGAKAAVDVIKNAINTVSSVRGTLGATSNRLDHTMNNLSVMTENIQDAESTIRDTDVAEEMMAYTKNNILVQSAQAMLAQANQVPQGVLQLLQ
jgi:flagellin